MDNKAKVDLDKKTLPSTCYQQAVGEKLDNKQILKGEKLDDKEILKL